MYCWEYRLSAIPETNPRDFVIISRDVSVGNASKQFNYMPMEDYLIFLRENRYLNTSTYEVVRGDSPHRMFIDIDDKLEEGNEYSRMELIKYINPYLRSISSVMRDYVSRRNMDHFDMYVYNSSHLNKISFHIIVGIEMPNVKVSKDIIRKIIKLHGKPCKIDSDIYNRNRSFRTIYSKKINNPDERIKRPFMAYRYTIKSRRLSLLNPTDEEYIIKSVIQLIPEEERADYKKPIKKSQKIVKKKTSVEKVVEHNDIIKGTPDIIDKPLQINKLIDSKYIRNPLILYDVDVGTTNILTLRNRIDNDDASVKEYIDSNSEKIYKSYCDFARNNNMDVMTIRSINDSMIILNRTSSSYCVCCATEHDSDNAYIKIFNGDKLRIYYNCYRGGQRRQIYC